MTTETLARPENGNAHLLGTAPVDRGVARRRLAGLRPGLLHLEGRWPSASFLHWLSGGIGICMTYHRLLTHRSFAVRPQVAGIRDDDHRLLRLRGRRDPLGRRPPPAPRPLRRGGRTSTAPNGGFGWAHMFWWMTPDVTSDHTPAYHARWAPDLVKDPVHRCLDR